MEAHQRGKAHPTPAFSTHGARLPRIEGPGGSSPGRRKMRASRGGARRGQHEGDTVFSAQEPPPPPLSTLGSCHPAAVRARPPPSVLGHLRHRPRSAAPVFRAWPSPPLSALGGPYLPCSAAATTHPYLVLRQLRCESITFPSSSPPPPASCCPH